MDVQRIKRISDLMSYPCRKQRERRKALAFDGLLRGATILGDVAHDDCASDELLMRIFAHQRHDIEIQESVLGIEDLQIAADDLTGAGTLGEVQSTDHLSKRFAKAGFVDDSEEPAGGAIEVDDPPCWISDDDALENCVEDRLEKSLLACDFHKVVLDVARLDQPDAFNKLLEKSALHTEFIKASAATTHSFYAKSSSSSLTRRWKRSSAASMGAGELMSTPASVSVSIGKRVPPLRRKSKYLAGSPLSRT